MVMAWMLTLKVLAVSSAVVFTALGVKASIPIATTHLPLLWNICLLCFKPPLLYLLLNAIIIFIVASSTCFNHYSFHTPPLPPPPPPPIPQPQLLHVNPLPLNASVSPTPQDEDEEEEKTIDLGGVVVDSVEESTCRPPLHTFDSTEIPPEYLSPTEKPLVSARFAHRKPPKSIPEGGKALRVVARPKRHETLENTWKTITEGRAMPLSRHVRKCDTWHNRGSEGPHEVNKSETFKERTSNQPLTPDSVSVSRRLRREPSLSQDELNRRVEAFISNFNEQMRLQRQESLNQYMQMIHRGAH